MELSIFSLTITLAHNNYTYSGIYSLLEMLFQKPTIPGDRVS